MAEYHDQSTLRISDSSSHQSTPHVRRRSSGSEVNLSFCCPTFDLSLKPKAMMTDSVFISEL